ncbi:Uncharacterised protein [Vibrio cholerae]|nr:Uncharacterised protein [Vibrio cholerae]
MPEFFEPIENFFPFMLARSAMVPVGARSERTIKCSTFCHSIETERNWF